MTANLDELSWGVAQEGQVVEDIMQHGRPPGGPRMLQGPLTLLYWPATCIRVFTQLFSHSFVHLFACLSVHSFVPASIQGPNMFRRPPLKPKHTQV